MSDRAPTPSGEVAACPTCGLHNRQWVDCSKCPTCGGTGVVPKTPDCGEVETPEAAVEAGVEVLDEIVRSVGSLGDVQPHSAIVHRILTAAIPHLKAAGWTPPGGTE